jgi:hypothetical protein
MSFGDLFRKDRPDKMPKITRSRLTLLRRGLGGGRRLTTHWSGDGAEFSVECYFGSAAVPVTVKSVSDFDVVSVGCVDPTVR